MTFLDKPPATMKMLHQLDKETARCSIAWVDQNKLLRECLIISLRNSYPQANIRQFKSTDHFLSQRGSRIDAVVYHGREPYEASLRDLSALRLVDRTAGIIFLSPFSYRQPAIAFREALEAGASAVAPTQTTDLSQLWSIIQIVSTGDVLGPFDDLVNIPVPRFMMRGGKHGFYTLRRRHGDVV